MLDQFLTPAFYAIVTPLIIAAVFFVKNWFERNSLEEMQNSLKLTLGNIQLQATIAAEQAEFAAQELLRAKEAQEALVVTIAQVVQTTEAANTKQAEISAKVNGQMTSLHAEIAQLRNDLAASHLATTTEKEKASVAAVQAEKERGDAAVRLAEALTKQAVPPAPFPPGADAMRAEEMDHNGDLTVTIPETPVPTENTMPLIIAP